MAQPTVHTNFSSGEWAPKLRSRVDIQKYRTGAAFLRNFFIDYSGGGASTRQGTKIVNFALSRPRLVEFQPSVSFAYVLEFGDHYIRFHQNGAPIVEAGVAISSITGSPVTVNSTAHGYSNGDWVFISGQYYIVTNALTNSYQLNNVYPSGTTVNSLTGTQAQRVYTITSPYAQSDLFPNQGTGNPGIKFVQNVTSMIITHPSYPPQLLTLVAPTNWTLTAITFGPTVDAPSPTLSAPITGTGWYYSYVVTSVDGNGQESAASVPATASNVGNINLVNPSALSVTWTAVAGAVSYNVYKASPAYNAAVPSGSQVGFVSNVRGTSYQESYPGVTPDFSQTPPIISSPITGGNVTSITLTGNATYSVVPTVTIPAPPSGFTATAYASLHSSAGLSVNTGLQSVSSTAGNDPRGLTVLFPNGITGNITAATYSGVGTLWTVTGIGQTSGGSLTGAGASVPANPITAIQLTGTSIFGISASYFSLVGPIHPLTVNVLNWNIGSLVLIQGGFGYTTPPTPTFSPSGASATTTVNQLSQGGGSGSATPVGNPRAVGFYQERLVFASPNAGLQSFYMSQPGTFYNFNVSNPSQASDAIFGSIISEELNAIKSLINVPTGILALTGGGAWLINGGGGISTASPVTPSNISATPQAFNGANDIRPLKINFDALFVTNKANYVRSASYHIYYNVFIGADISTISNHLFFNYQIIDWCWAEEPFKVVWAVRSDGNLLSLTYVKEQELIGWAHHDTQGDFQSCCSVIETNIGGVGEPNTVDAVYLATLRLLGDGNLYHIIERMADRYFTYGVEDSWSVDCGLRTQPIVTDSNAGIAGNNTVVGSTVTITLFGPTGQFTSGMAGTSVFRANGGVYPIVTFTDAFHVTATVGKVPAELGPFPTTEVLVQDYSIWNLVTTVSGLNHLANMPVVGAADGVAVGPLTVSNTGTVTLSTPASKVTLGLAFTPQLQTLPLDLGEPTVQGKRKKIVAMTLRVADTLGLSAGTTFPNVVSMKDFTLGGFNITNNVPVTDLYVGDGRIIIDQEWQEAGSYCIQQNLPYPATILGVFPEVTVGDTPK
jgi:hypothetical protein